MEDRLDIIAKQLVDNKYCDNKNLLEYLNLFDKFCLNKFYNMDFHVGKTFSDLELCFESCRQGYIKVVQYFIDKDINVNIQDDYTQTALITASLFGKVEVVNILLQHHDIDVNIHGMFGNTALMFASKYCEVEVVKLLLQQPDIKTNIQNNNGKTALDLTTSDEIKELIKNHDKQKFINT
jgi:ankyrin repeat protein